MNPESTANHAGNNYQSFADAFGISALEETYNDLLRSHHDAYLDAPRIAQGSDRLTRALFERQRQLHLAAASRQVLTGRYRFSPFLERQIPKETGVDQRTISVGKIRDVVVQRALYKYLYDAVDDRLTDSVFAYRRRLSAHDAITAIQKHFAAGRVHVFDADLRGFFDSLQHDTLRRLIEDLPVDERARHLAWRFCRAARITAETARTTLPGTRFPTTSRQRGVPQGGVLSGLLANLYLASMDQAVLAEGGALVRYADDFVVCCASKDDCSRMRSVVEAALRPLAIDLHPQKTRDCVDATRGLEFLGFELRPGVVRVRPQNVARFKQRVTKLSEQCNQKHFTSSSDALRWLCRRVGLKVTGPRAPHIDRMIEKGLASHRERRSWIGFFRVVTDEGQIRRLDRWIRAQISAHMWRHHRTRIRLTHMQAAGLPSLFGQLWKARAPGTVSSANPQPSSTPSRHHQPRHLDKRPDRRTM
ncbi:MAG: Retron-type reverse transcriptase [Polyangiaceae bacterium]|nr:Retron-type reverse transcriptase [Polyangiaceae bacterium]